MFLICSFDDFVDPDLNTTFYSSLFDWYLTSNSSKITTDQFSINQINPLKFTLYPKENLSFVYKNKSKSTESIEDKKSIFKN